MTELFSNKNRAEAEAVLNNSLRFVGFITALTTVAFTVFQQETVVALFSKRYIDSAPLLSLLMVSLCIGLVGNTLGTSLVALGQSDKPVKINIVDTITNLVGNLIMIPAFGVMGAVSASILSRCATNPVNVWFLRRANVRVRVSEYLKPVLVMGVLLAFFYVFKPESMILKGSLIGFFIFLCMGLSVIKRTDFQVIFSGIRSHRIQPAKYEKMGS